MHTNTRTSNFFSGLRYGCRSASSKFENYATPAHVKTVMTSRGMQDKNFTQPSFNRTSPSLAHATSAADEEFFRILAGRSK